MSVPPAARRTGTSLQLPWVMGNRAANPACGGREVQPAPRRRAVPGGEGKYSAQEREIYPQLWAG